MASPALAAAKRAKLQRLRQEALRRVEARFGGELPEPMLRLALALLRSVRLAALQPTDDIQFVAQTLQSWDTARGQVLAATTVAEVRAVRAEWP
jgi:hypothetical protein